MAGHDGMDFFEHASMDSRRGRMVWIGSKNPHPFNRRFIYLARGANVKMPWLLAFARRVEDSPYWAQKPRSPTFMLPDTTLQTFKIWRRTRLAMPKTILHVGLDVIEAWFGGY